MYVVDFFKRLVQQNNWGILLYLVLNLLILTLLFRSIFAALIFYVINVILALSPIGEWILRKVYGAKKLKRKEIREQIEPAFLRVYKKALQKDPELAKDITLFYTQEPFPNAFAVGRKTICVSKGLMQLPEEEIEAIIAHEFGHLSHKDTDISLVIYVGNLLATQLIFIANVALRFRSFLQNGVLGIFLAVTVVMAAFMKLWTKFGFLFIAHSSRQSEYLADQFAHDLGYGYELASALDKLSGQEPENDFHQMLYSTHPPTDDRIGNLQELGVDYRSY